MRLLFCGDVVGRGGRDAIKTWIPNLREKYKLDGVIVNAENAAHGFGLKPETCREFYGYGVDVLTTGNHVWDQREILSYIDQDPRLIRPINYPPDTPGRGITSFQTSKNQTVVVINVMGKLFMDPMDDPFRCVDEALKNWILGRTAHAIVIDIHAEATSEKMAMGYFCDGRVSLVVGTHTHVPTADVRILPKGTAYQSDVGMCGDYDSVLGMQKDIPIHKFLKKTPAPKKMEPATGEATLCGIIVDIDESGKTTKAIPIRVGGILGSTDITLDK